MHRAFATSAGLLVGWLLLIQIGEPVQAAFYPDSLSGNVLWMRADRDVYTDAGVTLATNGQKVQQWDDQALLLGLNNATQTDSVRQPTYNTGVLGNNLRPALSFANTGLFLPLDLGGAKTIFVVYKINSITAGTSQSLLTIKDNTGPLFTEILLGNGASGYQNISTRHAFASGGGSVGYHATYDTTTLHILASSYNGGTNTATSSYDISYDLASQTVVTSGAVGRAAGTAQGTIGIRFDSPSTYTLGFNGLIGEIIVFDRDLSLAETQQVESYLNKVYNQPEPATVLLLGLGAVCMVRRPTRR